MSGVRSTKLVVGGTFVCVDLFAVLVAYLGGFSVPRTKSAGYFVRFDVVLNDNNLQK